MSRLEEIAKKLNSVGLSTNDDLQDALMVYFCEDDADNNNDTDDDDTNGEDDAIPVPLSLTVIPQINSDFTRPVFWYGSCSDDTGTSQTMDKGEDKLISNFMDKTCCHLKCTECFNKETVLHSRVNAQELNHFSQTEHVNFLHVSILGGLNCCVAVIELRQTAVKFLENFAIQNVVVLPGRVPGFKNPDLLLLPSEFTKKAIHGKYVDVCLEGNTESIHILAIITRISRD